MPGPMLIAPDSERTPSTTTAITAFARAVATALVAAIIAAALVAGVARMSFAKDVSGRWTMDPEYVRALADAGYSRLSPATIVAARDHGLTAAYVRRAVAGLERKPSIERIIERHDRGESPPVGS